jgi:cytochrome c oxidase subunit 4
MQDFLQQTFVGRIFGQRKLLPGTEHHGVHHVSPLWQLVVVFASLVALTYVTVSATHYDFGRLNVWIALLIAMVKGMIVTTFFMHLKYDRPFNVFLFYVCFLFVVLFLGFSMLDTTTYQPIIIPGTAPGMV